MQGIIFRFFWQYGNLQQLRRKRLCFCIKTKYRYLPGCLHSRTRGLRVTLTDFGKLR